MQSNVVKFLGFFMVGFALGFVSSGNVSVAGETDLSKFKSADEVLTTLHSARKDSQSLSALHLEIATSVLPQPKFAFDSRSDEIFETLLSKGLVNEALATQVLTKPEWINRPKSTEWAHKIMYHGGAGAWSIIQTTLAQESWANERGAEIARYAIGKKVDYFSLSSKYFDEAVIEVLKGAAWQKQASLTLELTERLLLANIASPSALLALLKSPTLAKDPITADLMRVYQDTLMDPDLVGALSAMATPEFAENPKALEIWRLFAAGDGKPLDRILSLPHWQTHEGLRKLCKEQAPTSNCLKLAFPVAEEKSLLHRVLRFFHVTVVTGFAVI
ncbi:hypothetical protein WDW86_16665 [Bdellovibrionota bacterium FG-2]